MKKFFEKLKRLLAPVDKTFLIGFTLLTVITYAPDARWLLTTLAGYGLIACQVMYYARRST